MEKEYFVLYTPEEMNKAYNLMSENYSSEQIMDILSADSDDISRQVCLIKLDKISSKRHADILISLLTGQHGPIREICSSKINDFMKNEETRQFFIGEETQKILLDALNDIIPTVARNILEVIKYLPESKAFCSALMQRIIDLKDYQDEENLSSHEITKKTFKLYWYMEALSEITDEITDMEKLKEIIEFTYRDENYTIREKSAKILSRITGLEEYKEVLKQDENPYVFFYLK